MVEAFRISVGPTPAELYSHPDQTSGTSEGDYLSKNVVLINTSASVITVYLGGDNAVSSATGARWIPEAGRTLSIDIEPGESLWAICDDTGINQGIDVLVNGR